MIEGSSPVLIQTTNSVISGVGIFNGILYWVLHGNTEGIAVMTNYESTARTWYFTGVNLFQVPQKIHIVTYALV